MSLLERMTRSAPAEAFARPQSFSTFPFNLRASATGSLVTVDTALELIPVYSAVNLIASAIGSLPCKVYSLADRSEARSSRQWRMLHEQPNEETAADEFWQWVTACLLLWGNAFIYKQRDQNGVVQQLWPIRPSRVLVGREPVPDGGSRRYFIIDNRPGRVYDVDILHIRGLGTDGLVGYSPIQLARQQIANDEAQQEFLGTFLKNGLFSSAVFTHPNRLSKEAQERLREQISNRAGWLRAGEAITLEEGADLKNLTMSLVDSEFVSMSKMSEHRIAQLFGLIPPHTWGATDQGKTMTYQNSEFGGLEFVKWTLRPLLVRLEASVQRDQGVFPSPGPVLFPEFLVDALLRADTFTRWQAYQLGYGKWINAKWIQEVENITIPEGSVIVPAPDQPSIGVGPADAALEQPVEAGPQKALPPGRALEQNGHRDMHALDVLDDLRSIMRPEIRVDSPVTVMPATQLPPDVVVNEADHSEAFLAMADAINNLGRIVEGKELSVIVEPADVLVNVPAQPAPVVNVTLADEPEQLKIDFQRNPNGSIKSATVTDG